jgi:hypothetical protein
MAAEMAVKAELVKLHQIGGTAAVAELGGILEPVETAVGMTVGLTQVRGLGKMVPAAAAVVVVVVKAEALCHLPAEELVF